MTEAVAGSLFWSRPGTRLGRWAVVLAGIFVLMFVINSIVFIPVFGQGPSPALWLRTLLASYGILLMLCGLSAGVVGLLAVIRQHERSWLVWLAILPLAFVVFFLLGEFLVPH
jgi:hypothetical protein